MSVGAAKRTEAADGRQADREKKARGGERPEKADRQNMKRKKIRCTFCQLW